MTRGQIDLLELAVELLVVLAVAPYALELLDQPARERLGIHRLRLLARYPLRAGYDALVAGGVAVHHRRLLHRLVLPDVLLARVALRHLCSVAVEGK